MKIFLLLINTILSINSYSLNSNLNVYKRVYDDKFIKVYEPKNINKKELTSLVFYTGANSMIPGDIYSNFVKSLTEFNFSVNIVNNHNDITNKFLYDINNQYKEIIALTHSSGYVNAIQTINNHKNINRAIFLDPVDNSKLVNFKMENNFEKLFTFINKFNNIDNNNDNINNDDDDDMKLNNIDDVLIINAGKSYKWSNFQVPFIPVFSLNVDKLQENNKDLIIEKIDAEEYGHSDVLDSLWSDLMHVSLSKGNENRDFENLDKYHTWISKQIYDFVVKDEVYDDQTYYALE
jgi:hypothetical protein